MRSYWAPVPAIARTNFHGNGGRLLRSARNDFPPHSRMRAEGHLLNPIFGGLVYAFRTELSRPQERISNSHENAHQPGLDHDFSRGLIDILVSRYRIFEPRPARQGGGRSLARSGEGSELIAVTEYAAEERAEIKITKPLQTGLSV